MVNYAYQDHEYDFEVEVHVEVRIEDGEIFAIFYSIDPETGLPPPVEIGFLPPEPANETDDPVPGAGRGQGHLAYAVMPKPDLTSGTEIRNVATIQFDFSLEIETNQVDPLDPSKGTDPEKEALVTIDADTPTATVGALPASSPSPVAVAWGGASASGMHAFDVYVRPQGGAWKSWLVNTTRTSAAFAGAPGTTYEFYAVGTNNVGVRGNYLPVVQASTTAQADTIGLGIGITTAGAVRLAWTARPGLLYQVQASNDQINWIDAGPAQSTMAPSETLTHTDENYDGATNQFYRIVME